MPIRVYAPLGHSGQAGRGEGAPPPAFRPSAWLQASQARAHQLLDQERARLGAWGTAQREQLLQRGQGYLRRLPGAGAAMTIAPAVGALYYGAQLAAPVINRALGVRSGFIGGQVRRAVGAAEYDAHVAAGGRPSDFLRGFP